MKQGKDLTTLAKQIKHEHEAKHDFRVPTNKLHYTALTGEANNGLVQFKVKGKAHQVQPNNLCLRQIGERAGIPSKYVQRMREDAPQLLATNINHWWHNQPEKRMLRTLMNGESIGRAFVSDSYRPLDNYDLAEVVLPKLQDIGCEVLSSEITERRLYIQAATPRIELDLNALRKAGTKLQDVDPVQAGICISNSEVSEGALAMDQLLWRLSCLNGMVAARVMRRTHIGRRSDPIFELEDATEYYSDRTKQLDDQVLWNKVRDVVDALFDLGRFTTLCEKFAGAASVRISGTEAVEEITRRFDLVEAEKNSVLNHLIEGGELNVFGLANAVTRASTDVESYDRAVELERIGGEIIELPPTVWSMEQREPAAVAAVRRRR